MIEQKKNTHAVTKKKMAMKMQKQIHKRVHESEKRRDQEARARLVARTLDVYEKAKVTKDTSALKTLIEAMDSECRVESLRACFHRASEREHHRWLLDLFPLCDFERCDFFFTEHVENKSIDLIKARFASSKIPFLYQHFAECITVASLEELAQHMDLASVRERWMTDHLSVIDPSEAAFLVENFDNWAEAQT